MLTFSNTEHKLYEQIEVTEKFAAIETPARFKGMLYQHQCSVVKAMLDLEDTRVIKIASTKEFDKLSNSNPIIETSAMVLSEPFGSGKTFEILSMIMIRPIPRAFPVHVNSIALKTNIRMRRRYGVPDAAPFQTEIIRSFTGPDALIKPNLIIVGSSVLVQWEEAIREFTDLKCLVVGDYYGLVKFRKLYEMRRISAYDIILLKNGKVTGNFVLDGEDPNERRDYRSLISVVGTLTAASCWSRVFYDDFDTISIPTGSCVINSLFTVYVSATTKSDTNIKPKVITYGSLAEGFSSRMTPLSHVTTDKTLFSNFNVRNTAEFTETSTNITIIQGYRYVYANPDDNYIRLLGAMGAEDATNIMEMLNGDAIDTAADALGIKSTSVADIFQKMLDNKYEKYMYDQYVLDTLEKFRLEVLPLLEDHPEGKRHTGAELETIRGIITKKVVPTESKCKFHSILLEQMVDDMTSEFRAAKEHDGIAINRVIDNIKEGECQVCRLPLEDFDTFIVRCCGLILCDVCGIKGSQIGMRYDYKTKTNTLVGSCANCKARVDPRYDLIFVDKNFDLEAVLKSKGDELGEVIEEPEPVVEEPIADDAKPVIEIKNPKLKALLAICRGQVPEKRESIEINIPHLLKGRVDIPPTDDTPRKVLVFANYNETLNMVENFLVEHGVEFLRLGGTYSQISETVKRFHTHGTVLLINSQQHCAGLNLQHCSSDLVFFHKLMDKNVESQVAGRSIRIGRTSNLRLHYLAYRNEQALI